MLDYYNETSVTSSKHQKIELINSEIHYVVQDLWGIFLKIFWCIYFKTMLGTTGLSFYKITIRFH